MRHSLYQGIAGANIHALSPPEPGAWQNRNRVRVGSCIASDIANADDVRRRRPQGEVNGQGSS